MDTDTKHLATGDVRRKLLERSGDLTMLPAVASEALELAKNPDCSITQFTAVVERDVQLAMDVLSFANSVAIGGSAVSTLEHAVVRLGYAKCRSLILASCAASLMKRLPIEQEWVQEVLWSHSFMTASACSHLNRLMDLGFEGEEFAAGLLHDVGRFLLAVAEPGLFAEADPLDFCEDGDHLDRERLLIGVDHCEFGAWFAQKNGLPTPLVAVIEFHHAPGTEHVNRTLIALTAAADHIANHLQRTGEAKNYEPQSNDGIAHLAHAIDAPLDRFVDVADVVLGEIMQDTANAIGGCS